MGWEFAHPPPLHRPAASGRRQEQQCQGAAVPALVGPRAALCGARRLWGRGPATVAPPRRGGRKGCDISASRKYTLGKTEWEMKARAGWAQLGLLEVGGDRWVPRRLAASEALGPCWAGLPGAYLAACFHRWSVRRERDHTAAERPGNL